MKVSITASVLIGLLGVSLPLKAIDVALVVPGTSNIWLAGQPNGATLPGPDVAPGQSPVNTGLNVSNGGSITFSATGTVGYPGEVAGPDGASTGSHGADFGLSGITNARWNALIGVFIDSNVPGGVAPASLDFGAAGLTQNFTSLSPLLNQVFFIGDGVTSGAVVQEFNIPNGATRLFLGTLDGFGWYNNIGQFNVNVSYPRGGGQPAGVPDGGSTLLLLSGGVAALLSVASRKR